MSQELRPSGFVVIEEATEFSLSDFRKLQRYFRAYPIKSVACREALKESTTASAPTTRRDSIKPETAATPASQMSRARNLTEDDVDSSRSGFWRF